MIKIQTLDQSNPEAKSSELWSEETDALEGVLFAVAGIHCTHGFNRTGFLIVSYLVEQMDCSLEGALNQFAVVR